MMAFVALLFVSTKRNRGHIGSNTSNQSAAKKAPLANDPGATGDRGKTLLPGASVSRVARRHDVNANQVFYWRKLYREGSSEVGRMRSLCRLRSRIIDL